MAYHLRKAGLAIVTIEPVLPAARVAATRSDLAFACSLSDLQLPSDVLPAVGLFDVIEHLDDPVSVLKECVRTLEPGGIAVVTVPAYQWLWSAMDDIAGHKKRYSRQQLIHEAAAAGLEVVDVRSFFFLLTIAAAPLRLFERRQPRTRDRESLKREERQLDPGPVVDSLLKGIHGVERLAARAVPLPFGLSLLGLFQKPSRRSR